MSSFIIIGGGMSGLSLAWYLKKFLGDNANIVVLEAEHRAGGKAWTDRRDGFVVERGVNGVLDNKPSTIGLAQELGLGLLRSNDESRIRFVVRGGRLVRLPDGPGAFLRSPILSSSGKVRLLCEPFIEKLQPDIDESLACFARRRLGDEAFRYLIDPMASGIYAGNPERLSLKACFPRIHELEQKHGSLIRAMIALQIKALKEGRKKKASAGPGGVLTSFKSGMSELPEALSDSLKGHLRCNTKADALWREDGVWKVQTSGGEILEADNVVLSLPAFDASEVVKGFSIPLSRLFAYFEYPPIAVCAFAFRKHVVEDLNGFGFLSPRCEKMAILGCLWDSSVFRFRAPEGYHLVRCLMGGMRNRHVLEFDDAHLFHLALADLKKTIGIKAEPEFAVCYRWKRAIPQYHVGHHRLLEQIRDELRRWKGLYIRCNWIGGVSLNDCIANSMALARHIALGEDSYRF